MKKLVLSILLIGSGLQASNRNVGVWQGFKNSVYNTYSGIRKALPTMTVFGSGASVAGATVYTAKKMNDAGITSLKDINLKDLSNKEQLLGAAAVVGTTYLAYRGCRWVSDIFTERSIKQIDDKIFESEQDYIIAKADGKACDFKNWRMVSGFPSKNTYAFPFEVVNNSKTVKSDFISDVTAKIFNSSVKVIADAINSIIDEERELSQDLKYLLNIYDFSKLIKDKNLISAQLNSYNVNQFNKLLVDILNEIKFERNTIKYAAKVYVKVLRSIVRLQQIKYALDN